MSTKTLEERLQEAEDAIRQAEIEVGLRKKQLNELKPKRQEYEDKSIKEFGVPIQELNDYITSQEKEGERLIESLEKELDAAKQGA